MQTARPFHLNAIRVLAELGARYEHETGDDLRDAQSEFRGALIIIAGTALAVGHDELRRAIRENAIRLHLTDDDMTEIALGHIASQKICFEEYADRDPLLVHGGGSKLEIAGLRAQSH